MTESELSHSEESGRTLARRPQVWGAVPLRNPDFVGREELLEQLRIRLLEPGDRATAVLPEALHGMGGVGKSQTVVEYIYRHASECDIVWWIPSEHPTTIRSSFVDLANWLDLLKEIGDQLKFDLGLSRALNRFHPGVDVLVDKGCRSRTGDRRRVGVTTR